jgi:flagellar FliL protein
MAKEKAKEAEAEEKEDDKAEDKKAKDKGKDKAKDKDKDADAKEGEDGAEGEGGEGGEGEAAPGMSKKKKLIIIGGVAALVLLIGGGAGLYFSGILGGGSEEMSGDMVMGPDGKPIEKPVFYTLPEFLVNLNTGGKTSSFLKTTVILELAKSSDTSLIEANLPRLIDSCNTYLRELRASDLAGSAGIQRLREELLLRANKALAPAKVNDVLFKEIIVQ